MDIVIRAAVAYAFIIFILRVMGRRELSSLGPSDLVLVVVLGDLVQNGVTQADQSISGMFIAISTFAVLTVAMSVLTFKSKRAQTLIEGQPLILVEDGIPVEKNLRAERIRVDDIADEARGQGIEKIDDIKWCLLETSGTMSFVKKKQ
jgi:uncharacterized membrane protein YcaP (DUF421 family)